MRVLSPVGTFPLRFTGVRFAEKRRLVDQAMGAWRSEVQFDRHDVPLIGAVVGIMAAAFLLGRLSRRRV